MNLKESDEAEQNYHFHHGDASRTTPTDSTAAEPRTLSKLFLKDKELLQNEMAGMANLAVPSILAYLLDMIPDIFTIILVGRVAYDDEVDGEVTSNLQKLHMDGAALAVMFVNVVAFSPGFGKFDVLSWQCILCRRTMQPFDYSLPHRFDMLFLRFPENEGILTALDTLCSQAFGAGQTSKIGTYSLTAIAVLSVFFAFGSIIICNASSILISLGQPVEVSHFAGVFLLYRLPGIPFLYVDELIGTVYEARNNAMPALVAVVVYNVVSFLLGYYLVRWTEWGWLGAAVARTVADILTVPAILVAAIVFPGDEEGDDTSELSRHRDELDPLGYLEEESVSDAGSRDGCKKDDSNFLHDMWKGCVVSEALNTNAIVEFLHLGIPGMLQVMFEWYVRVFLC